MEELAFEGREFRGTAGEPERAWPSDDGTIMHVRGLPLFNTFEGTCGGEPCSFEVPIVANMDVDAATQSNGSVYGTYRYVSTGEGHTWGDRVGAFDNIFWGEMTEGTIHATFVGIGTGDLLGMTLHGKLVSHLDGEIPVAATIRDNNI